MSGLVKILALLAALAFVLAVITAFTGPIVVGVQAEGYSRASTNLALLALAFAFGWKEEGAAG